MISLTPEHFSEPLTSSRILDWCGLLLGAVHRLAWQGPDDAGDRARCLTRLTEILPQAWSEYPEERVAVTVVDWWLAAVGFDGPVGVAWRPEAHLADAPLSASLRFVLEQGGLLTLDQPRRFLASRAKLELILQQVPRIKKQVGQDIYGEARAEAYSVLHAAEAGEEKPPPGLRLMTDDLEDWASEVRLTDRLQRHLKVWNSVVKHLTTLREAVAAVVASWTNESFAPLELELDHEAWARTHCPSRLSLVAACLADLAALTRTGAGKVETGFSPQGVLQALTVVPGDLGLERKVAMLAIIREAAAAGGALTIPEWSQQAEEQLEDLRTTIRSLRAEAEAVGVDDSVQGLGQALVELDQLRIGEAESWIQFAQETLQAHAHDADAAKLTREMAAWIADLEESAHDSMDTLAAQEGELASSRHQRVREAWERHRDRLGGELERLVIRTKGGAGDSELQARISDAKRSLEQGKLGPARRLIDGASALADARRRMAEDKLRPELRALVDRVGTLRALTSYERGELTELITRATDRADEDLPFDGLTQSIEGFISACERGKLEEQPMLCSVGELTGLERNRRVIPVAWHPLGLMIDQQRLAPNGYRLLSAEYVETQQTGNLVVVVPKRNWIEPLRVELPLAKAPTAPPEGIWYDIISSASLAGADIDELRAYPGRHDLSDQVFIEAEGMVQGPYTASETTEYLVPADERGFVARLDAEQFDALFGRVHVPAGALGQGRLLTPLPPDLDTLLFLDAVPWDNMDSSNIEIWLAGLLKDVDHARVTALASAIARLDSSGEILPKAILDQRVSRLAGLLETSRHLDHERNRAAQAFLETEEGHRELRRAADRRAESELEAVKRAVAARRKELETALASTQDELLQVQERLDQLHAEQRNERAALDGRLGALQREVEEMESLATDTRTRVLAGLLGHASAASAEKPRRPEAVGGPVFATPFERRGVISLSDLATEVSRDLAPWSDRQVANLLLSLIASPWILLAGPPGVGKSTFVRSLLTRLGHGPGTARYLELVVRRDWQDDAPLFGYWHPDRNSWEPSSEGFLEQLLRADDDGRRGLGGLYPFVLEELNLAAPEYYLARPISALEDRQPRVRLYGDQQEPTNSARYPASFPVGDNVRLLGTVNLDDTVERLSPRFLSRAAVIWMSPSLDALMRPAPAPREPEAAVDWRDLRALADRPPVELGDLHRVVRYLHEQRVPGAPSPRTMRGMERYLAIATDLLPARVAQDYQVLQRILPCVRGVGERYRRIFDDLAALLRTHQWSMSAERCEELRARGEELGDYYDFFHV